LGVVVVMWLLSITEVLDTDFGRRGHRRPFRSL
jgi:hypothetical protein